MKRVLACGALLGLALACPPVIAGPDEADHAEAPRPEPGVKVLVLGIDGVSMNLLEPFERRGVVPVLAQLAGRGAQGKLASFWPLRTMQVWTALVTGKYPGQHGIWDHVTDSYFNPPPYRTKERHVYTPADRKSKALWQILGTRGIRSLTVGWPTTWPAEKVDHAVIVAPRVLYGDERRVTIKGSFWRHVQGAVQPARWTSRVRKRIVEPQDVAEEDLSILADAPPPDSPLYQLPKIKSYVYALRWNIARARSVEAITIDLARKTRPEVVLSYFQCTDSLLHRFWIFQKSEDEIRKRLEQFDIPTEHVAELKRRFGRVVENCYRDVDERVGRILEAIGGDDTLVLVVSDHGFGDGPAKHPFSREPYGGIHWSDGATIAAGPGIDAGSTIEDAAVIDVVPSLLCRLGLPVADDMPGKVLDFLCRKKPEIIPSYENTPQRDIPYREGFPPKPPSFIW